MVVALVLLGYGVAGEGVLERNFLFIVARPSGLGSGRRLFKRTNPAGSFYLAAVGAFTSGVLSGWASGVISALLFGGSVIMLALWWFMYEYGQKAVRGCL